MVPGSAICSSRAATLTASPVTTFWSKAAITSPVLTPTRIARLTPCCALNSPFSSVRRSSIWQAARSARSASSSRTIGTPKVAMTESPMNFWTVPPQASIVEVMPEKTRWRRPRQRSGSKRSPSVVDPVMSAKRTVTSLRSSIARSPTAAPQAGQKRAPAGIAAEHWGHIASIATIEAYSGIQARSTGAGRGSRTPTCKAAEKLIMLWTFRETRETAANGREGSRGEGSRRHQPDVGHPYPHPVSGAPPAPDRQRRASPGPEAAQRARVRRSARRQFGPHSPGHPGPRQRGLPPSNPWPRDVRPGGEARREDRDPLQLHREHARQRPRPGYPDPVSWAGRRRSDDCPGAEDAGAEAHPHSPAGLGRWRAGRPTGRLPQPAGGSQHPARRPD